MTTSAYRLEETNYTVDNIIEFDHYHRVNKAPISRFVPSDAAYSASTAQVAHAPRTRRNADTYLQRMVCETAPLFGVITVVFFLTVKLLFAI